jgi:hypothetical protein
MEAKLLHPLSVFAAFVAFTLLAHQVLWLGLQKMSGDAILATNVIVRLAGHFVLAVGVVVGLVRWKKKGADFWCVVGTGLCAAVLIFRIPAEFS